MPELPEVAITVERLRRGALRGTIRALEAPDPRILRTGTVGEWAERLVGRRIEAIGRKGKYLWLELSDGQSIVAHLRMTGKMAVRGAGEDPLPRVRFRAGLVGGKALVFADSRCLGELWLAAAGERERMPGLTRLGRDALEEPFTGEEWHAAAQRTKRPIKLLMMDQSPVCGIGNICAVEILFRAGIAPQRPADSLSREECDRLATVTPEFLRWAIAAQIDRSLKLFGERGAVNVYALYRRAGEPCPRCGGPIARTVIGQRGTFFCPTCQH